MYRRFFLTERCLGRRSVFLKYHRRERKPLDRAKRDWVRPWCSNRTYTFFVYVYVCVCVSNANRYVEEKADRTRRDGRETDSGTREIVMAKGNGPSRCDVCQPPLVRFTPLPLSRCSQRSGSFDRRQRPKRSENLSLIVFGPGRHRSISHRGNEFPRS